MLNAAIGARDLAAGMYRVAFGKDSTNGVFMIARGIAKIRPTKFKFLLRMSSNRDCVRMRRPVTIDLGALATMPDGTLGREVARFLRSQNLDPNFYPPVTIASDADYIKLRLRQTHDIFHVVTGFSASPADEIGLQAFQWAQTHSPVSAAIVLAGMVGVFFDSPKRWLEPLRAILRGLRLGRAADSLFAAPWDELWGHNVVTIRRQYNVAAE